MNHDIPLLPYEYLSPLETPIDTSSDETNQIDNIPHPHLEESIFEIRSDPDIRSISYIHLLYEEDISTYIPPLPYMHAIHMKDTFNTEKMAPNSMPLFPPQQPSQQEHQPNPASAFPDPLNTDTKGNHQTQSSS